MPRGRPRAYYTWRHTYLSYSKATCRFAKFKHRHHTRHLARTPRGFPLALRQRRHIRCSAIAMPLVLRHNPTVQNRLARRIGLQMLRHYHMSTTHLSKHRSNRLSTRQNNKQVHTGRPTQPRRSAARVPNSHRYTIRRVSLPRRIRGKLTNNTK